MTRKLVCIIIVLIICTSCFNVSKNEKVNPTEQSPVFQGPYEVEYVIDGDTIQCKIDGRSVYVRMIGIDAPESVHPEEGKNSEEGSIVAEYVKELLDGKEVYLEYDIDKEDDYGRCLAYVYLDETMLNTMLLEVGYAKVMKIEPNIKYSNLFEEIQSKAQENKSGFWKKFFRNY